MVRRLTGTSDGMAQKVKPVDPDSDEGKGIKRKFRENVNMTPSQIETWLGGQKSKSVGQAGGTGGRT